jgi:hypothetical protein
LTLAQTYPANNGPYGSRFRYVQQFVGGGGGGGVGLLGAGSSGSGGTNGSFEGGAGTAGSGGQNGTSATLTDIGNGGANGAGGGAQHYSNNVYFNACMEEVGYDFRDGYGGAGGGGAVRIIWAGTSGITRAFPSTNTGDL